MTTMTFQNLAQRIVGLNRALCNTRASYTCLNVMISFYPWNIFLFKPNFRAAKK